MSVVLCADAIDLSVLKRISLGKGVFGGELKLVMKGMCVEL